MKQSVQKIPGGKLKITFELTNEETDKMRQRAAQVISQNYELPGFRPGRAPLEIIKQRVSQAVIDQETVLVAVKEYYLKTVLQNKLDVIGQPAVELRVSSPLVFDVVVDKLPEVDLGNWQKVEVVGKKVQVTETEVNKIIDDIRDKQASEIVVARPAALGDKVVINFVVSVDKVAIEGGSQQDYPVIIGHNQLVPGFEDNLIGLVSGQTKEFSFTFPADYQKSLAGKLALAKVTVKQVLERRLPELDETLVKNLGYFKSVDDLKNKLRQNLLDEKNNDEAVRLERELLEKLVSQAQFEELPVSLVEREAQAMINELSHSLEHKGLAWSDYLANIKRTEQDLQKEFQPQAEQRVKVALLIRQFVKQHNLEIDEASFNQEWHNVLQSYQHDRESFNRLQTEDYKDYLRSSLTNKKVVAWLKERLVKNT